MPLDVTPAGLTSTSYATVAEADAYWAKRPGATATAWAAESAPVLENALEVAADQMQCVRYFGSRFNSAQSLAFPRDYHINDDEEPVVLDCIKHAQIEQAGHVVAVSASSGGVGADDIASLRTLGLTSVKIGTTSLGFGDASSVRDPRRDELVAYGFSVKAAILLALFISRIGRVVPDSEALRRLTEIRAPELIA